MSSWAADKKTVLCVGTIVIDFVSVTKKYPIEDRDIRSHNGQWQRGGHASNNCTVLKSLGADVEFFGMLSRAEAFRMLLEDMNKMNIKYSQCPRTDLEPPFSLVTLVKETKSTTVVHCNRSFPYITVEDFQRLDLNNYGWVHFECKSPKETLLMIRAVQDFNNGREKKIKTSLYFGGFFDECVVLCNMVNYVFLNKELAISQGWENPEDACYGLYEKLQLRPSLDVNRPHILCDWGKKGIGCLQNNNIYHQIEAYKPKTVVDSLGKKDTVIGAFVFARYIRERTVKTSAEFASLAASISCESHGLSKVNEALTSFKW